jgi:hypothetical protein
MTATAVLGERRDDEKEQTESQGKQGFSHDRKCLSTYDTR